MSNEIICAVITENDGVCTVENLIVFDNLSAIPAVKSAMGYDYLEPVDERVQIGDVYDSENGIFTRDGARVYPDLSDKERIAALEDAMCDMDEANAERFAAIEDALCDIDAGAGA